MWHSIWLLSGTRAVLDGCSGVMTICQRPVSAPSLATQSPGKTLARACWPQVLFNIIYDSLLGAKLKWHALVPVIDSMNHASSSKVQLHMNFSTSLPISIISL